MVNDAMAEPIEQPATDTPTANPPATPSSAPTPDASAADDGDLGLLAAAGDGEADPDAEAEAVGEGEQEVEDFEANPFARPQDETELAAWRKMGGIPDTPESYDLKSFGEPNNVTSQFAALAHELDLPQDKLSKIGTWWTKTIAAVEAQQAEAEKAARKAARTTLQEAWGDEYKSELGRVNKLLKDKDFIEPALSKALDAATLPDGSRLLANADFIALLADVARIAYQTPADAVASRIKDIEHVMRTDLDSYRDQGMDRELLSLMRRKNGEAPPPKPAPPAHEMQSAEEDAAELQALDKLMRTNIDSFHEPWKNTGMTGSQRMLQLARKQQRAR